MSTLQTCNLSFRCELLVLLAGFFHILSLSYGNQFSYRNNSTGICPLQHEKLENPIHSNRGNMLSMEITLDEEGFDLSAYEQQQGPKWENAQSRYLDRYFFFQHLHGISKCFIKPLICPFTHTFTHTFTHQLAVVAMQGTGRPIASNLGLSVGFKPLNPSTTITPPLHHHHYYHHH